jgi:hypothetical protein
MLLFSILKNVGSLTLNRYQELRLLHTGGPAGAAAAGEGAAGGLQRTVRGSGAQPQQQRGAAARQRRGGERAGQPPAACSGQWIFFSRCQVVLRGSLLGLVPSAWYFDQIHNVLVGILDLGSKLFVMDTLFDS